MEVGAPPDEAGDTALSLVRGDFAFRLQRSIGLVPAGGLGVGRRALVLAAITWLPIAAWATWTNRATAGIGEPLLQHFGVSVRCLVAIPLFVLAEASAHATTSRLIPQFARAGLVVRSDRERLGAIVRDIGRLRDRVQPWLALVVVVAAWTLLSADPGAHELRWAEEGAGRRLGFGGAWFVYVARPLYLLLALAWLWRLGLLGWLLARIARLPLAIVPTHPDRAGGLGFLADLPRFFAPVALGISAVAAARWAHDVVYHGHDVMALRLPMIGVVLLLVALAFAPLLVFAPRLAATRRAALLEYAALVARHGRGVHERWIEGRRVDDDALLNAPELGPVGDTGSLYAAVKAMRSLPIERGALLGVALPAALPMLAVLSLQVPIRELLKKVLAAVV